MDDSILSGAGDRYHQKQDSGSFLHDPQPFEDRISGIGRFALAAVLLLCVACDDTPAETSALKYLQHRYGTRHFTIKQNRTRGARHRMLIRHDGRLFKLDVARVPPHQVVKDRYPDLLVGRAIESTVPASLNPVVDVRLLPPARDATTSPEVAKKMVKEIEWCDLYLSVILKPKKSPDEYLPQIREALRAVRVSTAKLRRWEVNFYSEEAAGEDVRYRPVVARGLMQQVTEHRPLSEQIDHRWQGRGDTGADPLEGMRRIDLVAARLENEQNQRLIREKMKEIEQAPARGPAVETTQVESAKWLKGAKLQVFGSLHQVMMKGEHDARVPLGHFLGPGNVHGVGAMAGLEGEVTFDDGLLWISQVTSSGEVTTRKIVSGTPFDEQATLLGVVQIPRWVGQKLPAPLELAQLGQTVRARARARGWPDEQPVPFRIEGVLDSVSLHVIDGTRLEPGPSSHDAHRKAAVVLEERGAHAHLIGVMGERLAGKLTHAGSTVHVHVTLSERNVTGHVDAVRIAAHAVLKLPAEP